MAKTQTFAEIATQLQEENDRLKNLQKHFERACKDEFGYGIKEIHKMISTCERFEARKALQQGQKHQSEQSEE